LGGCQEPRGSGTVLGRLGRRDELTLDQKTSEGFQESVPKAAGQCGLQEHPSNKPTARVSPCLAAAAA